MGKAAFEASLAGGGHQRLARMAGQWSGTTRVWFEPDKPPASESPQHGSLRRVLGGRFVLHEYSTSFDGKEQQGIALIGLHLDEGAFECACIDSFHTGTAIMFSVAAAGDDPFAVLGSYGGGNGWNVSASRCYSCRAWRGSRITSRRGSVMSSMA